MGMARMSNVSNDRRKALSGLQSVVRFVFIILKFVSY